MLEVIWLLPAVPLAGFAVLLVFGRRIGEPLAGWLATAICAARRSSWPPSRSARCCPARPRSARSSRCSTTWLPVGGLHVDMAFRADQLSIAMALFVTGIGALIHLYAIGYMHGDPKFTKFFVYLNLFVFSMLMLVLGDEPGRHVPRLGGRRASAPTSWSRSGRPDRAADGGQEGVHHQPGRRRRVHDRHVPHLRGGRLAQLRRAERRRARAGCSRSRRPTGSPRSCSSARSASRPSCRCTSGCPTPWRARPRSPP